MPTLVGVGILAFISRINFLLNLIEHEKSFINLRPVLFAVLRLRGLIYHKRVFFPMKARKKYYHMRV